ncbi:MAG: sugar transferase [Clostridia bacterium]|nr:sugar transferase [Clostridia bacterium]
MDNKKRKPIYYFIKRILDVIISLIALVLISPLFLVVSLAIKKDSKGSVLYKHKRIGKNGKSIEVYKFRSMYQNSEQQLENLLKNSKIKDEWEENFKLKNDPRITKVGKFLRRTSLDELPQFFNVIKGDMSIVGPRPVVSDEIKKFGNDKEKILSVRPGLTGWWVCNRNEDTTYDERIQLELYYVDKQSFILDTKCFFKTINSLLKKEGENNGENKL